MKKYKIKKTITLLILLSVLIIPGCKNTDDVECITADCEVENCVHNEKQVCDYLEELSGEHTRHDELRQKAERLDKNHKDYYCGWDCDKETQNLCHIYCVKKGVNYDPLIFLLLNK